MTRSVAGAAAAAVGFAAGASVGLAAGAGVLVGAGAAGAAVAVGAAGAGAGVGVGGGGAAHAANTLAAAAPASPARNDRRLMDARFTVSYLRAVSPRLTVMTKRPPTSAVYCSLGGRTRDWATTGDKLRPEATIQTARSPDHQQPLRHPSETVVQWARELARG